MKKEQIQPSLQSPLRDDYPSTTVDWLQYGGNALSNVLRLYASWVIFLQSTASALWRRIPKTILKGTDFILPVIRIINGLKLLNNTFFYRRGKWTRFICFLAGLGGIGLGIVAILMPTLGLTFAIANMINNTVLGLWNIAVAVKNKYWGEWQEKRMEREKNEVAFHQALCNRDNRSNLSVLKNNIRDLKKQECHLNADLAVKVYNTGIVFLAVVGMVMTLFPSTLLPGAFLALATSIHGAIFGYDLSGKLPCCIQNYFFDDEYPPDSPDSFRTAETLSVLGATPGKEKPIQPANSKENRLSPTHARNRSRQWRPHTPPCDASESTSSPPRPRL